jgi:ribonuclease-3
LIHITNPVIALRFLISSKKKFNKELVNILGYFPKNWKIYELAFIHRSASFFLDDNSVVNNERLEFLGDALLDAIVTEYLFSYYPEKDEGFLSKMRSKIVKRKHLDFLAKKLEIDKFIITDSTGARTGKHAYGNAFEALIGAIYLDKGYNIARNFLIRNIFEKNIDIIELEKTETDFKSRIIELAQKSHIEISFESQEEYGSEAHSPIFISRVMVSNQLIGQGKGSSKKEAEQNAAEQAFNAIKII